MKEKKKRERKNTTPNRKETKKERLDKVKN